MALSETFWIETESKKDIKSPTDEFEKWKKKPSLKSIA